MLYCTKEILLWQLNSMALVFFCFALWHGHLGRVFHGLEARATM